MKCQNRPCCERIPTLGTSAGVSHGAGLHEGGLGDFKNWISIYFHLSGMFVIRLLFYEEKDCEKMKLFTIWHCS